MDNQFIISYINFNGKIDTGYWMLGTGYWMLGTGYWMLD
jgi:hypothetical protein